LQRRCERSNKALSRQAVAVEITACAILPQASAAALGLSGGTARLIRSHGSERSQGELFDGGKRAGWLSSRRYKQKNRLNGGFFVLARLAALPAGLRYQRNASTT